MHRHNLSMVLSAIRRSGEVSRANLADTTGLTKATISSLVDHLIDVGLVRESRTTETGKIGRPGRPLTLNGEYLVGVGLEVNVDYVAVCVLDLTGAAPFRRVVRVDNREVSPDEALDALASLGVEALEWLEGKGLRAGGVTIGVPGLVEVETGMLLSAPNLGWTNLPFSEMAKDRLGRSDLTIHVENEANLGALGELWEGRGREWGDFVHISGEIGVGAGLVFGGDIWRGFGGQAGEIGHLQIDRNGPDCPCGSRGCLEGFVGQEALLNSAGVDLVVGTTMGNSSGGSVTALVSSAQAGHGKTLETLAEAGRILGGACVTVANLLNPATIVLGGIYGPLAPWMLEPISDQLDRHSYTRRPQVVASELGMDAAVRGAASWALHRILNDPLLMPSIQTQSAS